MLWYMAHPIAQDDKYFSEQNLAHARKLYGMLLRMGHKVIAPWITCCDVLDDTKVEEREIGIAVDQEVLIRCDGIILHSMRARGKTILNMIGIPDAIFEELVSSKMYASFKDQ